MDGQEKNYILSDTNIIHLSIRFVACQFQISQIVETENRPISLNKTDWHVTMTTSWICPQPLD